MKKLITSGITALSIILASGNAIAQPPAASPALSSILDWEGTWSGPATLSAEGKTYTFDYSATFRSTAEGHGLTMDESFSHPELGHMMGANLIGYNANDGSIHWFSVDNMGTTHDHIGTWKSPGHFFMQASERQHNRKFVEKIDLTIKDRDHMDFRLAATLDGKTVTVIAASFSRKTAGQ
jgi:hypothetical protein